MANRQYKKFPFGFLNVAQDSTSIGDSEASDVFNIDPDALALGTLKYKDYSAIPTSTRNYLETTMGGRRFFLGSHDQYSRYVDGTQFQSGGYFGLNPKNGNSFIGFEIYLENTNDGFILGTDTTSISTTCGRFGFRVASGNLVCIAHDAQDSQTTTVISSVQSGQWYRIAMVDRVSATGTKFYVDGREAGTMAYGATDDVLTQSQFRVGVASNNLDFRLSDFIWWNHIAEAPTEWDGTFQSFGPKKDDTFYRDELVLSFRSGYPVDNAQDIKFYDVGTNPIEIVQSSGSASGELFAELSPSAGSKTFPASTQFTSTQTTVVRQTTGNNPPFSDTKTFFFSCLLNIEAQAGLTGGSGSNLDFCLFSFGFNPTIPKGLQVILSITDSNPGTLIFRTENTLAGFSGDYTAKTDVTTCGYFRFSIAMYKEDTPGDEELYTAKTYIDGRETQSVTFEGATSGGFTMFEPTFAEQYHTVNRKLSGTTDFTVRYDMRDLFIGQLKENGIVRLPFWDGTREDLNNYVNPWMTTLTGDLRDNQQDVINATTGSPLAIAASTFNDIPTLIDKVNDGRGPVTPDVPTLSMESDFEIDDSTFATQGQPELSLEVQPGKSYNGPEEATIIIRNVATTTSSFSSSWRLGFEYKADGQTKFKKVFGDYGDAYVNINYNLRVVLDDSVDPSTYTGTPTGPPPDEYTLYAKSTEVLDGKYQYRVVGVRTSFVVPEQEILSIPSKSVQIAINNIDAGGERKANNVPVVTIPAANPGYPNYTDRVDLYRKDPDSDQFVKVAENKSLGPIVFRDKTPLTELPRVEFLPNEKTEDFAKINEAIGNPSGTFEKVINKDNRVFLVPTDRQDLILYSDENAWWQWKRENTFRFNGNIVELSLVRDTTVLSGQQTLVVSTTTGIYHLIGNGTEESPYEVLPVLGGDGFTDLEVMPSSQINANGDIFLMTKSASGAYDEGAYGQKVYQYDLQKLIEISGRIRGSDALDGTGGLEFANLIAGDKYLLKKTDSDNGLVYHKDARGWLYFNTTESGWKWTSKFFTRDVMSRGSVEVPTEETAVNPAAAKQFKVDYIGSITVRFYFEDGAGDERKIEVNFSSVGLRREFQNVMPSGMGRKWRLEIEGDSASEVFGFWFVI